ncbi:hypothetical protein [Verminephrobacter eiseniae]|uniref:Uncharacterized protein n=1 Tax=Verminephrobacter eiseniae (strain EF01-2) TaxID=391735 RepID=A1WPA8_VEREI|nr:hypothetical protein [Verminephrobacter eiseniae]ABM59465.1 hypothetical protein Veis_3753 [Verminephrobacter eiseniae EF01-2]MCW5284988.1 hypothetical protein [Verminephrobacter eiseniae]MCW5302696.1 hypothetical protein [Verminephrobacter eiseniae]MCW8178245.1 hypothetical protein [Verminephrobacter eiseniae]MCW8188975.1 hypothetical protein [Verminephrobacter eiseniae]
MVANEKTTANANLSPISPIREGLVGPAFQEQIEVVNREFLKLINLAAILGESEPLAEVILGLSHEAIQELRNAGATQMLAAQAMGLPLVELRIKDAKTLQSIVQSGFGSQEAISIVLKSMPLELMTKARRR